MSKTLIVEGWRFVAHSYALINQHQCLEMLERPELQLFHRDVPYAGSWRSTQGLLPDEDEAKLRAIPVARPGAAADAVLRMGVPHAFHNDAGATRTFVWGTTEFGCVEDAAIGAGRPAREVLPRMESSIVTCSTWSARGFIASGAPSEKVFVVPCGAATSVFYPLPVERRAALRQKLGWHDRFVLLNVSAMTTNKGIVMLLKCAAALAQRYSELMVVLKGSDELFVSRGLIDKAMAKMTPGERAKLEGRVRYIGTTLRSADIASLFQAADLYVSPYHGEGFNLPVLEAAACGLPIVCTAGGATDDFVRDDFALRIASTLRARPQGGEYLLPDHVHLIELVSLAIEDRTFREMARRAGPAWVNERFTWRHTVDKLLSVLFELPLAEGQAGLDPRALSASQDDRADAECGPAPH